MPAPFVVTFDGPVSEGVLVLSDVNETVAKQRAEAKITDYFKNYKYQVVVNVLNSIKIRHMKPGEIVFVFVGDL